ncbi:ATP-binding protein [Streptomyces viridochromogenes]|uniref:ATP-binding protein n=1 Tax=Streptomyces viridochromogenes TaxID=1938 RepID=UPI0031D7F650
MYVTVEDLVRTPQDAGRMRDHSDPALSVPAVPDDGTVVRALVHHPAAAGTARSITRGVLEDWHVDQAAMESVLLVVSELVTNAVEHALPPVVLRLHWDRIGDRVWVGVTDGGPAQADGAWTSSCTQEEHGRGLAVVEVLTSGHGTRTHSNGAATHWAVLNIHEQAA